MVLVEVQGEGRDMMVLPIGVEYNLRVDRIEWGGIHKGMMGVLMGWLMHSSAAYKVYIVKKGEQDNWRQQGVVMTMGLFFRS